MTGTLSKLKALRSLSSKVTILGSTDGELQTMLDRLGLCEHTVTVIPGPWSSFILQDGHQQIALGPALAKTLEVTIA